MPISAEPLTIQGYPWAPKFSLLAERALQKAGFDQGQFRTALSSDVMGQGMSPENEVLLVWAGQQTADRRITPEAVKWRRERMGPEKWTNLVRWFAILYGTWDIARMTARAELYAASLTQVEERI